jgi:hypothetical protein
MNDLDSQGQTGTGSTGTSHPKKVKSGVVDLTAGKETKKIPVILAKEGVLAAPVSPKSSVKKFNLGDSLKDILALAKEQNGKVSETDLEE